ncbi:MAG: hypothetical protein R6U70_02320 [Bacillota bacterium]
MGEKSTQDRLQKTSRKMQQLGCLLTALITVPVLGTLFLGIPGLIMGIIIAGIVLIAQSKKKHDAGE